MPISALARSLILSPPRSARPLCTRSAVGPGGLGAVSKPTDIPTLKLYRDCMRLTYHIAAASAKGDAMRPLGRFPPLHCDSRPDRLDPP